MTKVTDNLVMDSYETLSQLSKLTTADIIATVLDHLKLWDASQIASISVDPHQSYIEIDFSTNQAWQFANEASWWSKGAVKVQSADMGTIGKVRLHAVTTERGRVEAGTIYSL
ncbi:hypothetical protein [Vibrio breoganii]|uniref:hypothetical protein n=1 Tax=Vibrio breoganii TaxID=553239 RepID=UPI000C8220AC|nr:hypothetical protein [Vibrio breoganii]PMM26368.1 hypothetical protein BCT59_02685 [Vibrio breoganii]